MTYKKRRIKRRIRRTQKKPKIRRLKTTKRSITRKKPKSRKRIHKIRKNKITLFNKKSKVKKIKPRKTLNLRPLSKVAVVIIIFFGLGFLTYRFSFFEIQGQIVKTIPSLGGFIYYMALSWSILISGLILRKKYRLKDFNLVRKPKNKQLPLKRSLVAKNINETELDVLYELVKVKKKIKISQVAKDFGIKKDQVEVWVRILERNDLIEIHYPAIGEPEIRCKTSKITQ